MRNAIRASISLAVLLMALTAWQVLVAEAKAVAAEVTREADSELRELLTYSGPDADRQFESIATLQRMLGYNVSDAHAQIIRHQNLTHFGENKRDLVLAFRGLGKTTTGTIVRSIAYILRDPEVRILIASASTEPAEALHEAIHGHLSTNETLIRLFGPFYDDNAKTRSGRFAKRASTILQRKNVSLPEGTITVLGAGKQAAMRHFEVAFADDIVVGETARTSRQRANLDSWYGSTLAGTFIPQTKVHHIGTRYCTGDKWDIMENGRRGDPHGPLTGKVLRLPMVRNYAAPRDQWEPTFPDLTTRQECIDKYFEMGPLDFPAQMQQDTSAGEGRYFKYADLMWYGNDQADEARPPQGLAYFQYTDMAAKKTEAGDFFVNLTIGVTRESEPGLRRYFVVDMVRERAGFHRQREIILQQVEKWNPIVAGVEAAQAQAGFAEEVRELFDPRVTPCPVREDKGLRASRIVSWVEQHRVYLPMPGTAAGIAVEALIGELCTFDGMAKSGDDHDDCVDAFVGAMSLATTNGLLDGVGTVVGAGTLEALAL